MAIPLIPLRLLLAGLVLVSPGVLAHVAHQHGVAEVDLVREGDELEIQLKVDGEGVVGFERAPRDGAERSKVEAARAALGDGAALFLLPAGAACVMVAGDVDVPHADAADGHAHHDHDAAKPEAHADWKASYRFECGRGTAADSVDLAGLFAAFPGIARANLQWITDDGQSGVALRPGRSRAALVAE
jgi:hypothetical protein